ncbi:hypothetical protein Avbf_03686 [Armadillidium vulgare]|nr:hypothetical protein Avbf_03686 [Armadillidium vulgare]
MKYLIEKRSYKVNEKSTQDWQDWRTSIPEELLKFAQEDCDDVIKILGYKNLGDIEKARDLNYSVLEKYYCTDIPCK